MKLSFLLLSFLLSTLANARNIDPNEIHVETTVTELAPEVSKRPVSSLPEAQQIPAPSFKGTRYQTKLGTLILNGGYIGEGNNYKLRAEFVCKNGRTSTLFTDLKFCEFRSVTNPVKGSFELVGQTLRFHYLAKITPDFSGMTSCSGPTYKEVAVDCTLPAPPKATR